MDIKEKLKKVKSFRESADALEKEIADNPPEGTALAEAKNLNALLMEMISIMGLSEEVDINKAREHRPNEEYDLLIFRLEQEADAMVRVAKSISNFVTLVNTGKIFDRSKETDTGIMLNTEELEKALIKTAESFRKDANSLKEV